MHVCFSRFFSQYVCFYKLNLFSLMPEDAKCLAKRCFPIKDVHTGFSADLYPQDTVSD